MNYINRLITRAYFTWMFMPKWAKYADITILILLLIVMYYVWC